MRNGPLFTKKTRQNWPNIGSSFAVDLHIHAKAHISLQMIFRVNDAFLLKWPSSSVKESFSGLLAFLFYFDAGGGWGKWWEGCFYRHSSDMFLIVFLFYFVSFCNSRVSLNSHFLVFLLRCECRCECLTDGRPDVYMMMRQCIYQGK